ncbi:hypothetical protein FCULG_00008184 [Fusarium culmorum]|uniref:Uncharacterized protein n=1 Tax=Fusarium culmorum TaxID=5516 RepID=A0A2T4H3I7_FUSCU|nr:hypothetical protein FCULG_00008184 [Fusarium culmorum]
MDNGDTNMDTTGFQFQANSTSKWDNELKFAAAGSVRTSIIVLAVFNLVVAFAVTLVILLRSWRTLKHTESWNFKSSWFRLVKGRDIYPFVLSIGIVTQGIVYATAQAKGLESLMILESFFVAPFIQLIFGLELTIRITKPNIFPFRGRFNTVACLASVGTLLLIVFSITFAIRPSEFCFASLVSFLHRYDTGIFGSLLTIIILVIVECGIICFKLHTGARMDITERDEASRMVYYMIIAVISYTLQITFYYNTAFHDPGAAGDASMQLSIIGTVVMNMSGFLLGCLYLFLRSSKSPTGCWDDDLEAPPNFKKWTDDQDQEPATPLSAMPGMAPKSSSRENLMADDRVEDKVFGARKDFLKGGLKPLRLGSMRNSDDLPTAPKPHLPQARGPKSPILLPTTYYKGPAAKAAPEPPSLADLLAPPALRLPDRRLRSSGASALSTATVQIGLRLSNIGGDMSPTKPEPKQDTNRVEELDCPNSTVRFFPRKTSPLAIAIVDVPGEGTRYQIQDNFENDLSEKELPPVPLSAGMATPPETTLSSAVYSPQKPTPGPSSHKPNKPSVSSRAHSRQGSTMGDISRLHSRHGSRAEVDTGRGPWI